MLKPTKDWVLTKVVDKEEPKETVVLVESAKPTKNVEIVAFGPEANKGNELEIGNVVMVQSHTGLKHSVDGEEFEFAKEHNFLGVVE